MPRVRVRFETPDMGVRYDIEPGSLPANALRDAQNMVFRRGRFQPRYGLASPGNAVGEKVIAALPLGVTYKIGASFGSDIVLVCGQSTWYYWTTGPNWIGLTGSIAAANHAVFRVFAKNNATYVLGCNNGVSVPKKWLAGVGNPLSDIGGSPPKAKAMMVLANRVLLFNLAANTGYTGVVSPVGYDVSAFNDFDSGWSTTLNGLLVDTPGEVVGALEMGDLQGAIYKSDAIVMAVAQGGVNPFHFEWRSFGNVGPANERCIMAINDGSHIFLGSDGGVYRFDGVNVRALDEGTGHIRKAIAKNLDPDINNLTNKAHGFFDRDKNEAYFFFKWGTGLGIAKNAYAVMINLNNLSVWPLAYSFDNSDVTAGTVAQYQGDTRPRLTLFTDTTGKFWAETDNQMIDNASSITATWDTGYSDAGAAGVMKTATESTHFLRSGTDDQSYNVGGIGAQDILVSLGGTATGNEGIYGSSQTVSTNTTTTEPMYQLDHRSTAEAFGLRYTVAVSKLFDWRGAILTMVTRGER